MFRVSKKKRVEIDEVGVIIGALERFISHVDRGDWDNDSAWDFDDHMSIKFDDERAEAVRQLVWLVSDAFPGQGKVFSPAGMDVLRCILESLKKERQK